MAIAFQDINQPDLTLVRLREPNGSDVYRPIEKESNNPMQQQMLMQQQMRMQMMGMAVPGKPPKPPRQTFPASGESIRLEFRRRGTTSEYQVLDAKSGKSRYLGQAQFMQAMDVAAVKLFVTNRNGVEPVEVILKDLSIRADRVNGLGTIVRTVFDQVVYGDPTSIEKDTLIVGGQPKAPPAQPNKPGGGSTAGPQPGMPAPAPPATPPAGAVAVAAPAPAMAIVVAPGAVRVRQVVRPARVVAREREPGSFLHARERRSQAPGQAQKDPARRGG